MLAAERAALLLGCYRRSDANDPEIYATSVALVLAMYSEEVIIQATDPRTGISTHDKFVAFPPNSGELKKFCDGLAARIARMREVAKMPKVNLKRLPAPAIERPPGYLANLIVRRGHRRFNEMVERSKKADHAEWCTVPDGIKVPATWW